MVSMKWLLVLTMMAMPLAAGWKAGVATVDITPKDPVWLGGYAARNRPSEGVTHPIYAKALALEDDSGAVSVLVTADILGFHAEMSKVVADRVRQRYQLPRERLILNASHTHSAPVTGYVLRVAYPMTDAQFAQCNRYTDWLLDRVVAVIGEAMNKRQAVTLEFGQGLAGFAVNRRRVGHREWPGPVDHDVPVLKVAGAEGKILAVVFGYACHATVLDEHKVNGDWPGYAQSALERALPGTTALFVTGAGGDANPLPRRELKLAERYGDTLATEVANVLKGRMKPVRGRLRVALDTVEVPFSKAPGREEWERRKREASHFMDRQHAELMLQMLDRDGKLPEKYPYTAQVWQFGGDLKMIVMAGEVVVDYALRFKKQYGWDDTWIAAYSNDVFTYIPSLRVLREGGYEGGGAMVPYGLPGPFGAAVEELIAEKFDELVKRTGSD